MLLLLALLSSAPSSFASPEAACSRCASYGSPFGPEGYSYYCYFVERGNQRQGERFDSREACLASRNANASCQESEREPSGVRRSDPCWSL